MNIIKIKTTSSTNNYLKELSNEQPLEEGTVVIAEHQTAGKGQRGNSWESESGKNILCSMLLFPDFLAIRENFLLSEVVALAVKETLDSYVPDVKIKWPNDIYWKEFKMAGILIENELTGTQLSKSIIGIGVNINQDHFSGNIPNAISLKQIINRELNPEVVANELIQHIFSGYHKLRQGEFDWIEKAYYQSLYRKDGFYPYEDSEGTFRARIEKVGKDGYLYLVTDRNELRKYAFKEVKNKLSS